MILERLTEELAPAIEKALQDAVGQTRQETYEDLWFMLAYHMGWQGEGAGPTATGKRVRPILTLLVCAAVCGEWGHALPAAVSVELVHNFSLIHDDIQDNSPLRRGRPALWKKWGVAQAINAGDVMFTLAQKALLGLEERVSPQAALRAMGVLQETCIALTQGQYLDISYEARGDLSIAAYWPMVSGKTAALLSACTFLGALAAQADDFTCEAYRRFGRNLGLAFQALDDLLGIWGDAALTGKSSASDLLTGKKSLPVLFALAQGGEFARRWMQGPILAANIPEMASQLEMLGARAYTKARAAELTDQALVALDEAKPHGQAGEALRELADQLLTRHA